MRNLKIIALSLLLLFHSGYALAVPLTKSGEVLANTTNYVWNDSAYWALTDFTTHDEGDNIFILKLEQAAYESNFGLYTVDENGSITATQQVFGMSDEPYTNDDTQNVYFRNIDNDWQISIDGSNYKNFSNIFGFYYEVDTTDQGSEINYTFYSDADLNTMDAGIQHIATEYDGFSNVKIYLEDLLASNADWDWSDMTVMGNDLAPAPVPEPATMLLLGTGLIGLAGVSRKKMFKK
jgi:hypothetical protein